MINTIKTGQPKNSVPVRAGLYTIENVPLHQQPELEIVWVVSGTVNIDTIYEEYTLEEGDFLLIDRNDFHKISGTYNRNSVIIVHIDPVFIDQICGNKFPYFICEWHSGNRNYRDKINILKYYILRIMHQLCENPAADNKEISSLTESLVMTFLYHFNILNYFNSDKNFSSAQESRLLEIINYIKHNHKEKIRLSDISREENIETTYLSHLFKNVSALTFQEHLEFLKTEGALEMLINTELPVNRICFECGFSDIKYLYRGFKKWFNKTPGAIRKEYSKSRDTEELVKTKHDNETKAVLEELFKSISVKPEDMENSTEKNRGAKHPDFLIEKILEEYYAGIPVRKIIDEYRLPKATVYNWINKSKRNNAVLEADYQRLLEENKNLKREIELLRNKLDEKKAGR